MAPAQDFTPTPSVGFPYGPDKAHVQGSFDNLGGGVFVKETSDALTGPLVWSGADINGTNAYTLELSEADVVEVDNALESFKGQEHCHP